MWAICDSCFSSVQQQRIEIQKLRQGDNLILGFSIGGGIDQDPGQNPYSEDKSDKVSLYRQTGRNKMNADAFTQVHCMVQLSS